jgi:hypothetical protein
MSMNYGTLKTAVAGYLHRTDLTTQIPDFVDQARLRIGADLRALPNWTTGTVTSFSASLAALPANLSRLVSVTDSSGNPLMPLPLDIAGQYTGGVYAVAGSDLYVPGAGSSTIIALAYYSIPAALVNNADVSVPMLEYPNLWLYASVMEGALYVQDYELADRMGQLYKALTLDANRAGDEARFAAPAMVADQPMIQGMAAL